MPKQPPSSRLPSGETVKGTLIYHDEFTIGVRDDAGWYRAWPVSSVKYKIDAPAEAHAELLGSTRTTTFIT